MAELKFTVSESWRGNYFVSAKNNYGRETSNEYEIAKILGLMLEEYENLLIQNGGFLINSWSYIFRTKKECQEFIEKIIEPRLIMEKLTK